MTLNEHIQKKYGNRFELIPAPYECSNFTWVQLNLHKDYHHQTVSVDENLFEVTEEVLDRILEEVNCLYEKSYPEEIRLPLPESQ